MQQVQQAQQIQQEEQVQQRRISFKFHKQPQRRALKQLFYTINFKDTSMTRSHREVLQNGTFRLVIKSPQKFMQKSSFFSNVATWIFVALRKATPSVSQSHSSANKSLYVLELALFFNYGFNQAFLFRCLPEVLFSSFQKIRLEKLKCFFQLHNSHLLFKKLKLRHTIFSRTIFRK